MRIIFPSTVDVTTCILIAILLAILVVCIVLCLRLRDIEKKMTYFFQRTRTRDVEEMIEPLEQEMDELKRAIKEDFPDKQKRRIAAHKASED